ncbi:MAG: peptidylprolyl isomerase [Candidatus Methylacidiphilales bacterium]|nr:peptidylprolyl isomerase [Candidatus Methylacidiphilales bacterium]
MLLGSVSSTDIHAQQRSQLVDGVAAVVNKKVITFSAVRRKVGNAERLIVENMQGSPEAMQRVKELRLGTLRALIDQELIIQSFTEMGAFIPDNAIDEHIRRIVVEKFEGDRTAFIRTLAADGLSLENYRSTVKDQFIIKALEYKHISSSVIISPYRIEQYYSENYRRYLQEEQVNIRMIYIAASPFKDRRVNAAGKEEEYDSREEAIYAIAKRIQEGESFEDMARNYSEGSTRDSGGAMGFQKRTDLAPELGDVAFRLKLGEMSKVIKVTSEGNAGYYLLKVEEVKHAFVRPLAEVREEIEQALILDEKQRLQQEWLDGLRAKAYVKMF